MDAKAQLCTANTPIKDIAVSLGFNNAAFFNKFFKRHTGIPPQKFPHILKTIKSTQNTKCGYSAMRIPAFLNKRSLPSTYLLSNKKHITVEFLIFAV